MRKNIRGFLKKLAKPGTFLICGTLLELLAPKLALAWGPAVHTVVALSVLDGVSGILPFIGAAISANPIEYLYGSLAADFFIGKGRLLATRHIHHWEGGFKLAREASTEAEKAYAYGFLSHLAADVVAHNLFVPNMMRLFPRPRRTGHIYWEIKADYLMGPSYMRVARGVLTMDHALCDQLLSTVSGKKNGLMAKKRIFTQSVKVSDFLCASHPRLFNRSPLSAQAFANLVFNMVSLSCKLVLEFLKDPASSQSLTKDPLGKEAIEAAARKGVFFRLFRPSPRYRPFRTEKSLL